MKKNNRFALRMREIRKERGLSLREMGEILNVSYQRVWNLEKGGPVYIDNARRISKRLGIHDNSLVSLAMMDLAGARGIDFSMIPEQAHPA